MITHSLMTTQLRFFNDDPIEPFNVPYDAICTLTWETETVVWIVGLHGKLTRKLCRELANFLKENGIKTVKAHRSPGHVLPFAKDVGNNQFHIDVDEMFVKMGKKSA